MSGTGWSRETVLALAPDASSLKAAVKLSLPTPWSGTGASGRALWGLCAGSGKTPYQTVVDLDGPAYRCSCPSRKFPCKHALGLLLLWSGGGVPAADQVGDFASTWLAARAQKVASAAPVESSDPPAPRGALADPDVAAGRAAQRVDRVAAGLEELDRWLGDQVRTGLAGAAGTGYSYGSAMAARMVDAQAGGVASVLRRLPGVLASGEGWPSRLLEELAGLHLLVAAHRRLADLPPDIAADVRARVGYTVRSEDVLHTPPVRDEWAVLGVRDIPQDRLTLRRVWMRGSETGRSAVVSTFTPSGQAPDASLVAGTVLEADLHFYPASVPLRAVVGARHDGARVLRSLAAVGLSAAVEAYADAVAANPWTALWPVVVAGVLPCPGVEPNDPWRLVGDGIAVTLDPGGADVWRLLAVSGGHPVTVTGEISDRGLRPLGVLVVEERATSGPATRVDAHQGLVSL